MKVGEGGGAARTAGRLEAGFAEISGNHRSALFAHCRRMLESHEDAEDAVQETFLRAWRWRAKKREGASTGAWLRQIATNVCFDALGRRRSRQQAVEAIEAQTGHSVGQPPAAEGGPEAVTAGPEPESELTAKETVEIAYMEAIRHLPPRQHTVLVLRDVLGRSAKETADLMDSSVASVNSAGQRARRTLRERLPERRMEWSPDATPTERERELLTRYLEATERGDAEAIAGVAA